MEPMMVGVMTKIHLGILNARMTAYVKPTKLALTALKIHLAVGVVRTKFAWKETGPVRWVFYAQQAIFIS